MKSYPITDQLYISADSIEDVIITDRDAFGQILKIKVIMKSGCPFKSLDIEGEGAVRLVEAIENEEYIFT